MLKKSWLYVKRRWLPYLFAYSAKILTKVLVKSCRINIQGLENFIKTAEKKPCILMLWHNRLVIVPEILSTHAAQFIYTAFISKSRDGDPLALLTESYAFGRTLRVPHNARHVALGQLIESLKGKQEIVVITPDGPRGPRGIIKPGIVFAAKETGANIFPFSWNAKHFWRLNTWDQMIIPKPFTTIDVKWGEPLLLAKGGPESSDNEAAFLKDVLDALGTVKQ